MKKKSPHSRRIARVFLTTFYGKNEKIIDIIKCHVLTDSFEFYFIIGIYINKLC